MFDLERLPERLAIVGGGYIAVEFAGIFNGLGAKVPQLYRSPLFLRGFDADIRTHAAQEIRKTGVDLRFEINVQPIATARGGLQVRLTDGSAIDLDAVLYATERLSAATHNIADKRKNSPTINQKLWYIRRF